MIYSKTCEYAVRALAYMADSKDERLIMIPEISDQTGVPQAYISKIFQGLVRQDILSSQRGPAGGFRFKRNPETLTLKEIIESVDDLSMLEECVMGLDRCDAGNACPLHYIWVKAKEEMIQKLSRCTLSRLTKEIGKSGYRELKRSRLNITLQLGTA